MTPVEAAWIAGWQAKDAEKPVDACPHTRSDQRDAWILGWQSHRRTGGRLSREATETADRLGLTADVRSRLSRRVRRARRQQEMGGRTWATMPASVRNRLECLERERDEAKQDVLLLRARVRELEAELRSRPAVTNIRAILNAPIANLPAPAESEATRSFNAKLGGKAVAGTKTGKEWARGGLGAWTPKRRAGAA